MRLWRFVNRRMAAKLFAAVALLVGIALFVEALADARREVEALRDQTRGSATKLAHLIAGTVEQSMLQGLGIKVKKIVAHMKEQVPEADVHIYDRRGIEVFAPDRPAPPPQKIPPLVLATLTDHHRKTFGSTRVYRPIPADKRCRRCHHDQSALRGVLVLNLAPKECAASLDQTIRTLVKAGFIHIMTAGRHDLLDSYFATLSKRSRTIRTAGVYDARGHLAFGSAPPNLREEQVLTAARPHGPVRTLKRVTDTVELVPLAMGERCVACHSYKEGPVRGVLALSLAPDSRASGCDSMEIEGVIDASLRYIMLSQLGRRIADFLDAAAATPALKALSLYDDAGRLFWSTRHPPPPKGIAGALSSGKMSMATVGSGAHARVQVVQPLANHKGCTRCHGTKAKLLGVVSVSLSTAAASRMRSEIFETGAAFAVYALLGILLTLALLIRRLVGKPVRHIGDVADAVGRGDLTVAVERADPDGDEISRLGDRINAMVRGLRAKSQLERFVSKGAAAAAEGAGLRGVARRGERRFAAVLFSDIRGFTSYSETVDPEEVVAMLNRLLEAQARVVVEHGGDIDKFVGDELMAVFQGDDAASRAVTCAVELVDAVRAATGRSERAVGVGVAAGEVVYGALGSETRLDFTVIGDVVNTGARLCSAASADEVLVTGAVQEAAAGLNEIVFEPREALALKGKRSRVGVYRARYK